MRTSFKKLTSVFLAVLMLLSVFAVSASAADTNANSTGTNTVYFAPGDAGEADPAWFAWTWDGVTDQWVTGVQDGSYIRFDGCGNKIVFVRMPSGSTAGDWNTCWNQSEDLTVSDNLATFSSWNNQKFNVTWSHYDGGGDTPTTPTQSDDGITVTFNNSLGWSDVNVHYWNASGTGSTWPGVPMSGSGSVWTATIPSDSTGVVFNTNGGSAQTSDGDLSQGTAFTPTGAQDGEGHYVISAGGDTPIPTQGGSGDLFLFGTIGTTDFGSGATEWNQPNKYDLTSGTLTTSFEEEAYVGVKKLSTNTWYMTDGFPGMDETSATLYDADKYTFTGEKDKLHVPAGVEVTFTFVENADGSATLSYTIGGEAPTQGSEATVPTQGGSGDIFLFGTIGTTDFGNGAAEWNQPNKYDLTSGTLTTTFEEEAYVGVKKLSTNTWYMTDGFPGMDATSATLYDADKYEFTGEKDKLHVPGGVKVTFTFVENADGSATLSYTTGGEVPTQGSQETQATQPTQGGGNLATDKFAIVVYDAVEKADIGEFYIEGGYCEHTFANDSYIFIRKYNGGQQYCLGSTGDVFANPATFYPYPEQGDPSFPKMSVGGGDSKLWLVDNGNNTYSLYVNIEPEGPTEPTQVTESQATESQATESQATESQATQTQATQTQDTQAGDTLQASVKLNGTQVKVVDITDSTLTVTYNLTADKLITDGDFALSYDSSKLTLTSVSTPAITGGSIAKSPAYSSNPYLVNFTGVNQSTNSGIYDFKSGTAFVTAVFNVASGVKGTADVNLVIRELDGLENNVSTSYFADSAVTTAGQTLLPSLYNPTVNGGAQPTQTQATETQSQATETQSQQTTPTETQSQQTTPTETQSQQTTPTETQSQQTTPTETQSQQTTPTTPTQTQATTPTQTQATQQPTQAPATTIKVTAAKKTIYVNASTVVKATVNYGIGSTTFMSSNTKVATVNAAGKVVGKKAGTVTIKATNNGKVASVKIKVIKRANTMTVKAKKITAKASKKTTFKKSKAFTIKKAKGKVVFKKTKGNKKITINKKTGKITVKKGLKKGKTYKVKIKVTAKGNTVYKAKSKTVTIKVKVK